MRTLLLLPTALLFHAASADEAAAPVNLCVEVYELQQAHAFSLQRILTEGTAAQRLRAMEVLRSNERPEGTRIIAIGQCAWKAGERGQFSSGRELIYPSLFDPSPDGIPIPSAFEMRLVGTRAEFELTRGESPDALLLTSSVRTVELASRLANPADDARQPVFVESEVTTTAELTTGVPRLLGMHAPHPDLRGANAVLRVVVATLVGAVADTMPPPTSDACIEVWELPQPAAATFKNLFEAAPASERADVLNKLRTSATLIACGHRALRPGLQSSAGSLKEYAHPKRFETSGAGVHIPTEFETTKLGCQMPVTIKTEGMLVLQCGFKEIVRLSPAKDDTYSSDAQGDVVPAVFNRVDIRADTKFEPRVPQMIGAYLPHPTGKNVRMIFATVFR
ncbi:MAG: hypothetical protein R3F13_01375 [Prosthecobacter sp.]